MSENKAKIYGDVVRPYSLHLSCDGEYVCNGFAGTGYYTRVLDDGTECKPLDVVAPYDRLKVNYKYPFSKVGGFSFIASVVLVVVFLVSGNVFHNDIAHQVIGILMGISILVFVLCLVGQFLFDRRNRAADRSVSEIAALDLEAVAKEHSESTSPLVREVLGNFVNLYTPGSSAEPMDADAGMDDLLRRKYEAICQTFEDMMLNLDHSKTEANLFVGVFYGLKSEYDVPVFELSGYNSKLYLYPNFIILAYDNRSIKVYAIEDVEFAYIDGYIRFDEPTGYLSYSIPDSGRAKKFVAACNDYKVRNSKFFGEYQPVVADINRWVDDVFHDRLLRARISRYGKSMDEYLNGEIEVKRVFFLIMVDVYSALAGLGHSLDAASKEGQVAIYAINFLTFDFDDELIANEHYVLSADYSAQLDRIRTCMEKDKLEAGYLHFPRIFREIGVPESRIEEYCGYFGKLISLIVNADGKVTDTESKYMEMIS